MNLDIQRCFVFKYSTVPTFTPILPNSKSTHNILLSSTAQILQSSFFAFKTRRCQRNWWGNSINVSNIYGYHNALGCLTLSLLALLCEQSPSFTQLYNTPCKASFNWWRKHLALMKHTKKVHSPFFFFLFCVQQVKPFFFCFCFFF